MATKDKAPKTTKKPAKKAAAPKKVEPQLTEDSAKGFGLAKSIIGVMATIFVVAFIWVFLPLPGEGAPSKTVRSAWSAIKTNDLEAFEKAVDTEAFVKSLIEQVIAFEEINNSDAANVKSFRQLLNHGMIGAFRNDLAAAYTVQLSDLVKTGSLEERKDGLLWRLWQQTGQNPDYFTNLDVLDQNDQNALLTLNFERPDLGGTMLSLNILLEKNTKNDWQITGVPNLANFLFTIANRQKEQLDALNAPIQKRLNETVSIIDIQKVSGVSEAASSVLWHVAYRNASSRNVAAFKANLRIENGEGQYLGELEISDDDGLASGQTAERAWPMPLNVNNATDAEIMAASARVLKTNVTVSEVTFANGDVLTLLTELPETTTGTAE